MLAVHMCVEFGQGKRIDVMLSVVKRNLAKVGVILLCGATSRLAVASNESELCLGKT